MQTFQVDAAGWFQFLDEETAGQIGDLDLARLDDRHFVTSVQDAAGNLKAITWRVGDEGQIRRVGTVDGGPALDATVTSAISGGHVFAVTAGRQQDGTTRVQTFEASID